MTPNIHLAQRDQPQLALPEAVTHHHPQSDGNDGTLELDSSLNLDHLPQLLISMKWDNAISLIHMHRNDIENHIIKVVCQGETYVVTPMHFAVGTIPNCPLPVLEALVDAHPAALLQSDARRGLSPVHLGLIKGTIGIPQINYLLSVCPELALIDVSFDLVLGNTQKGGKLLLFCP